MQNIFSSTSDEPQKIKSETLEGKEIKVEDLTEIEANNHHLNLSFTKPSFEPKIIRSETLEGKEIKVEVEDLTDIDATNYLNFSSNEPSFEPKIIRSETLEGKEVEVEDLTDIDATNHHLNLSSNEPSIETHSSILEKELKGYELSLDILNKKLNAKTSEVKRLERQLLTKERKLQEMSSTYVVMKKKLQNYSKNIYHQNLEKLLVLDNEKLSEPKHNFFLTQLKYMFSEAFCWPEKVLRECKLLYDFSPNGYRSIMERNLVTLPSEMTLKKHIGP